MALSGAALRFIESSVHDAGTPGGIQRVTIAAQPTGTYPALGELISALFTALWALPSSSPKVPTGVKPSNVQITDSLGHVWTYDSAQGTAGALRCWTAVSNTPTEHATGAYDGNEASGVLRISMDFPLYSDMSR